MMKSLLALLMLSVPMSAVFSAERPARRIVVLCYIIHHGQGLDGKLDLPRIANVITSAAPDIVALQEVDRKTKRVGGVDQAEELARLTGLKSLFCASMPFGGGEYGNAVLTRLPIVGSSRVPLPGEPRSALFVDVSTGGDTLTFIATHLDTKDEPRRASLPIIEKHLATQGSKPVLLAGDLNALPDSPELIELRKVWTDSTSGTPRLTYPANKPEKQIDYVLCRPAQRWRVVETSVLDVPTASDHRPLRAVLELTEN